VWDATDTVIFFARLAEFPNLIVKNNIAVGTSYCVWVSAVEP
jgi:hypothetical protein